MGIYKPGRPAKYDPASDKSPKPPAKAGEYRIRSAGGEIVYIGETNNIRRRTAEHMRRGRLKPGADGCTVEYKVADGRSTSSTRRVHERQKIAEHKPRQNKSKGGEGRPAVK